MLFKSECDSLRKKDLLRCVYPPKSQEFYKGHVAIAPIGGGGCPGTRIPPWPASFNSARIRSLGLQETESLQNIDSYRPINGVQNGIQNKKAPRKAHIYCISGGEGGIRTHGTGNRTPDFESGTFDHSATSPLEPGILAESVTDLLLPF